MNFYNGCCVKNRNQETFVCPSHTWGQLVYINTSSNYSSKYQVQFKLHNTNYNDQFHMEIKICEQATIKIFNDKNNISVLKQLYLIPTHYGI